MQKIQLTTNRCEGSWKIFRSESRREFLWIYACLYRDISTNKIFATIDSTYPSLKDIIRDKDLVLLNGGKDSSFIAMNRTDCNNIVQKMFDDGIKNKIYEEGTGNIKDYENYDDIRAVSSQLAKLYGIAITHKFENLEDIMPQNWTITQLKIKREHLLVKLPNYFPTI